MSAPTYRDATAADLPAIIAMLAEEQIGGRKDDPAEPLDPVYLAAFEAIDGDPRQRLIVAELDGAIVGTMQLSFLPGVAFRGAWRGQIEAVRIAGSLRGSGLGTQMIEWAVARCRDRGCRMVQLMSKQDRLGAHRFYEKMGWGKSHFGFKIKIVQED